MTLLVSMLAVVVGLLALLVVGLLRSHAEILRALHALGVHLDGREQGTSAPPPSPRTSDPDALDRDAHDLTGVTAGGEHATIAVRATGDLTLIGFLSTGCLTCAGLWRELGGDPRTADVPASRLVIVTQGADRESPARVAELAPAGVTTILSSAAWNDYAVPGAPYFVLVDGTANRVIGEGTAPTWPRVTELVREAAGDAAFVVPGRSRREFLSGRQRTSRADRTLRAAGIGPGHPSLGPARGSPPTE